MATSGSTSVGTISGGQGIIVGGTGNSMRVTHNYGGGGSDEADRRGILWALLLGGSVALAAAAYQFAAHAMLVYRLMLGADILLAAIAGSSVWLDRADGIPWQAGWREAWALLLTILAGTLVVIAMHVYPDELTERALAVSTVRDFWCTLTAYGHGVALQHVFAAFALCVSVLLAIPHSLGGTLERWVGPDHASSRAVARIASKPLAAFSTLLCALSWWMLVYLPASSFSSIVPAALVGCGR